MDTEAHAQIKRAVWTVYCQGPAAMITGVLTANTVAMQKHFLILSEHQACTLTEMYYKNIEH